MYGVAADTGKDQKPCTGTVYDSSIVVALLVGTECQQLQISTFLWGEAARKRPRVRISSDARHTHHSICPDPVLKGNRK